LQGLKYKKMNLISYYSNHNKRLRPKLRLEENCQIVDINLDFITSIA
jgi:hypothetical protein